MAQCECGCGSEATGDFLPGHDQKLRSILERQVGGVLAMRVLVDASVAYVHGETTDQAFTQTVRAVLTKAVGLQKV